MNNDEYIRGWRRANAIPYILEELLKWNIPALKREMEILAGKAKPYKIVFTKTFVEGLRNMNFTEQEIAEITSKGIVEKGAP
jgi:hypothetical protein